MGSTPGSSATAGAGVLQAIGSLFGGFSEAGRLNAQAEIARNNAQLARWNANQAMAAGEARAEQQGFRTRAQVGSIRARQAGAGIDPNSGSAADVRASAAALGTLDALTIRSNAARQAYGYEVKATEQDAAQKAYRKGAKLAPWLGGFDAATSLLGTSASLSRQSAEWERTAGKESSSGGDGTVVGSDFGKQRESANWDLYG